MSSEKRVLVVDDNDVNRKLAGRLLAKRGWEISEAEDGDQALEWLGANSVELVLLDISMPRMCGEEVCRRVRASSLGGDGVRLVAYTAHAMPDEREKFMQAGFDTILTKPISRKSIEDLLQELGLEGVA